MQNLSQPVIDFSENNPEVKSYIHQQIADLEPFFTSETVVSIVAKDPRKLALQLETEGRPIPMKDLKKMFRVAIILRDADAELQEEGFDADVYVAIRQAKEKILATLSDIQDKVQSNSDRQEQINHALQNNQVH